jgi:hypothetical protein
MIISIRCSKPDLRVKATSGGITVRIRHYGIVSTRRKAQCLADARFSLGVAAPQKQATDWKTIAFKRLGFDPDRCPFCGQGKMVVIEKLAPERGPPKSIFKQIKRDGF